MPCQMIHREMTPTGERTFEARRPRRLLRTLHRVQLQDKNRQQFDPTHLSTASYFVMYAENNTYAQERRTKLGLPPLPAQTKLSWSSDSLEQMAEIEWKPAADVIRITPLFTNSRYSPILFWSRLPVPSFANQNHQTEEQITGRSTGTRDLLPYSFELCTFNTCLDAPAYLCSFSFLDRKKLIFIAHVNQKQEEPNHHPSITCFHTSNRLASCSALRASSSSNSSSL